MEAFTQAPVQSVEIEAVITRKDGRIEHLGTISYWSRNPILNWSWKMKQFVKRVFKGYY